MAQAKATDTQVLRDVFHSNRTTLDRTRLIPMRKRLNLKELN